MIAFCLGEPHRPVLFLKDHRHPVVQFVHFSVGRGRHDSEAAMHGLIRPAEAFPNACEGQRLSVLPRDRMGLLAAFDHLPLIERVRVHDAAPLRQGNWEHP